MPRAWSRLFPEREQAEVGLQVVTVREGQRAAIALEMVKVFADESSADGPEDLLRNKRAIRKVAGIRTYSATVKHALAS
ncbi:MAG: hypothetical protein ACRD0Y_03895 [Terriglobales bacterium]